MSSEITQEDVAMATTISSIHNHSESSSDDEDDYDADYSDETSVVGGLAAASMVVVFGVVVVIARSWIDVTEEALHGYLSVVHQYVFQSA